MTPTIKSARLLLDEIVRRNRSRLTALLVSRYGYHKLPLVEDAISDAIVKALEKWEYDGLPDHADAWLYRVSLNRAIDLMRKTAPEVELTQQLDALSADQPDTRDELDLFLYCCHPALKTLEQQYLILNLVFGLDHEDIANLTQTSKAAVSQRISRAKRKLRTNKTRLNMAELDWNQDITAAVAVAVYTAFTLGYFPLQNALAVRRDVANSALQLGLALADNTPQHADYRGGLYALCALMSFQFSRFDARQHDDGSLLLIDEQDKSKWDRALIHRGHECLVEARRAKLVTDFHIEAAITAVHTSIDKTDWQLISELYDSLLTIKPTPGRIIAAAVAQCRCSRPSVALDLLKGLPTTQMQSYPPYHLALSEALSLQNRTEEAEAALIAARDASKNPAITHHIEQRLH